MKRRRKIREERGKGGGRKGGERLGEERGKGGGRNGGGRKDGGGKGEEGKTGRGKERLRGRRRKRIIYILNKKKHCDILLRTLLMGTGLVAGDWEADHQQNKKMLYIIEPVVESLLQVA